MRIRRLLALATVVAALAGSAPAGRRSTTARAAKGNSMPFVLSSKAFQPGATIPAKFTCDGNDLSPQLSWSELPQGTRSLALIADDPDAPAGTWTHWVLFNLPPSSRELSEAIRPLAELPGGARQGRNDFRKIGYGGPCPPPGKPHRYFFKLHALDAALELPAGAAKTEVERAMEGHILAKAELMGTYARGKR